VQRATGLRFALPNESAFMSFRRRAAFPFF
jgi:hypothetical protein